MSICTHIHILTLTHTRTLSIHTCFCRKKSCHNLAFFWDSEVDNAASYSTNPRKSRVVLYKNAIPKSTAFLPFQKKVNKTFLPKSRDLIPFDCTSAKRVKNFEVD